EVEPSCSRQLSQGSIAGPTGRLRSTGGGGSAGYTGASCFSGATHALSSSVGSNSLVSFIVRLSELFRHGCDLHVLRLHLRGGRVELRFPLRVVLRDDRRIVFV